ncbi:MAG: YbaN family protein [Fusobacteriaceae bacterium]
MILGIIGVFLPILPTTPFVLLAAFLFEKSSPKFHQLLLSNKHLGKYITDYQEKKGITTVNKILSLIFFSFGIVKGYMSVDSAAMKIIFILIYFSVVFHILKLKTVE